ncbi:winged helix-turn-helix domain-containing protein [Paenibacillus sp. RRE4]|uniref:ArsR/SmtB family transcription factor n=1 Tax=Paenibacillus sp. RRE4 TaxID=2962587 RepID=UPI002882416A|nr:winged helix-turn-helix domain-containing protein [Paenibacillus sp. RRE4]MDT0124358.1 winged helix-turn-helix domain-containing protein [Paenibacillus sp. RRE4]
MDYKVEVDFSPMYECVNSLIAFTNKQNHNALDAGKSWIHEVQNRFTPAKLQLMRDMMKATDNFTLAPYIWTCPGERSVNGFMDWLEKLSTGELFDIASQFHMSVPSNLSSLRSQTLEVLREWNSRYFSQVKSVIIDELIREAEERRALIDGTNDKEVYEDATQGMRIYPTSKLKKVILIPQYHARPFVTSTIFDEVIFTNYACDIMPTEPGRPDPQLLRLTRALSDETRLVILRLLTGKQLSFSEIVREVKLSKSTIHYHLIFLRAAGLVLVHYDHKNTEYSLRLEALNRLPQQINDYFHN